MNYCGEEGQGTPSDVVRVIVIGPSTSSGIGITNPEQSQSTHTILWVLERVQPLYVQVGQLALPPAVGPFVHDHADHGPLKWTKRGKHSPQFDAIADTATNSLGANTKLESEAISTAIRLISESNSVTPGQGEFVSTSSVNPGATLAPELASTLAIGSAPGLPAIASRIGEAGSDWVAPAGIASPSVVTGGPPHGSVRSRVPSIVLVSTPSRAASLLRYTSIAPTALALVESSHPNITHAPPPTCSSHAR